MADKLVKEESLTAIGDAIRTATGTTDLLSFPTGMVEKLGSVEAIPAELLHYTGDGYHLFSYGGCSLKVIKLLGDKITTENLTNISSMFYCSDVETIPFDINCSNSQKTSLDSMFYGATNLVQLPKIKNCQVGDDLRQMFCRSLSLKEIPKDFCDTWNFDYLHRNSAFLVEIFRECYCLRNIPETFLKNLYANENSSTTYNTLYKGIVYDCHCLNEIVGLHPYGKYTSNAFSSSFYSINRLKRMVFDLQENNVPYVISWKNQVIDLSDYVGYASQLLTKYGMPADTRITDNTTYQALKDNPDAWTTDIAYSRYNHDSAVETINSLPDTSAYLATAGGTNTIKFKGAAGSATDGGAINTLTEEEIAVATAKGWTVSFV